jgi:hypothetical protein
LLFQGTFVEGLKEEVVLSPAHALSLIAAGEGHFSKYVSCLFILMFLLSENMSLKDSFGYFP